MKFSMVVLLLGLSGCGGQGLVARYSGTTLTQRQADYNACMYDTQRALASLNNNGTGYMLRAMNLNDLCMQQKGYAVN